MRFSLPALLPLCLLVFSLRAAQPSLSQSQYFRDGADSDVSQDRALKPIKGVQWQTGTMHVGKVTSTDTLVGLRIAGGTLPHAARNRLVARDARSGLPLRNGPSAIF